MLIKGGRLIDPAQGLDGRFDVRVRNGLIEAIAESLVAEPAEEVLDASNCCVAPGFIDMHVHLREPGNPEKETVATGTAAALAGGFTAVACMPNTTPAIDSADTIREVLALAARAARARVYPVGAISKGREGAQASDYRALAQAGAVAFSDDGNTVMNPQALWNFAAAAAACPPTLRRCFISHCEDETLKGSGLMTRSSVSERLGLEGSPAMAEDTIVARDLLIAQETGMPWHIAHVSTANSVDFVRWAKEKPLGTNVTCEVAPHHLLFNVAAVESLGARSKVNPPLRFEKDVKALRDAVRDGTIDVFATDHAPHTAKEKSSSMQSAAVGFTGLEIAVGAYALAVPDLPLTRFVEMLSTNPARVLGVPGGTLKIGETADITVFADRKWTVESGTFHSKGRATPFDGMTLPRRAVATVVGGELLMLDGRVLR